MYYNQPRTEADLRNGDTNNNFIANYGVDAIRRVRSDFEPRHSDIYVTTYPKCGTTWTCALVDHLRNQVTMGVAVGFSLNSCPWIDIWANDSAKWKRAVEYFKTMKSPRVFKSHSTLGLVYSADGVKPRIIHCVRNPLDTFVSGWHHMRQKPIFEYDGSWDHFFENLIMKDQFENGCWFQYHDEFLEAIEKDTAEVLLLKYEDMQADQSVKAIHQIAEFIGVSDYDADVISKKCSFKSMRVKADQVGYENMAGDVHAGFVDTFDGSSGQHSNAHLRKGVVGDWRNYYTSQQMDQWRTFVESKLKKYPRVLKLYDMNTFLGHSSA